MDPYLISNQVHAGVSQALIRRRSMRRALLADQIGKFKLERVNENGRISFKANGNIDFFGEEVLTRVDGAGGPAWTERLPVRFEWLAAA